MDLKTSAADGLASLGATWVGGVAPVDGDTIDQKHNIDWDYDCILGVSGVNGTLAGEQTANNKVLKILAGVTLELRGDFIIQGNFATLCYCIDGIAGSTLRFNSSLAADPTNTKYCCRPRAGGTGASYRFTGTDDNNRCIIESVVGGGNGYFSRGGFASTGQFSATFTNFIRIGDATNPFYEISYGSNGVTGTQSLLINDCIFDGCKGLNVTNSANANTVVDWQRNTMRNTVTAANSGGIFPTFTVAGTKLIKNSIFDKVVSIGNANWQIGGSYFLEGWASGARTALMTEDAPIFISKSTQPALDALADHKDGYFLQRGNVGNAHLLTGLGRIDRAYTIDGMIFDNPDSTDEAGDCLSSFNTTSARTHIIKNCIQLENSQNNAFGKFISGGGANVNYDTTHCTFPSSVDFIENGCSYGEIAGAHAGMFKVFDSNLAYSRTANKAVLGSRLVGTLQDGFTIATTRKNGTWNAHNGSEDVDGWHSHSANKMFTVAPEAPINVLNDPFVQLDANIKTWDASLGGPGTVDNAVTEMCKKNEPASFNTDYTLSNLVAYIRAARAVTASEFKDAGEDGLTIGAGAYAGSEGSGNPIIFPFYLRSSKYGNRIR